MWNDWCIKAALQSENYTLDFQKQIDKAFKDAQVRIERALAFDESIALKGQDLVLFKRMINMHIDELEASLDELDEKNKVIVKRKVSKLRRERRRKYVDSYTQAIVDINHAIDVLRLKQLRIMKEAKETTYQIGFFMLALAWYTLNGKHSKFDGMDAALLKPLAGQTYANRIWADKMPANIQQILQSEIKRKRKMASVRKDIRRLLKTGRNNAVRLLRTEANLTHNLGSAASFQEPRYQLIAVLDHRTSAICAEMDTKTFLVSEMEVGVNAPPFHPNCRTTIRPFTENPKTRQAWIDGKWETINFKTYYEYVEKYASEEFKRFVNARRKHA